MERTAADARYAKLHDDRKWHDGTFTSWVKEQSTSHPYRFDFGVTIGVADTDIRPDDDFLTREKAPLAAKQPQGDEGDASDTQHQDG